MLAPSVPHIPLYNPFVQRASVVDRRARAKRPAAVYAVSVHDAAMIPTPEDSPPFLPADLCTNTLKNEQIPTQSTLGQQLMEQLLAFQLQYSKQPLCPASTLGYLAAAEAFRTHQNPPTAATTAPLKRKRSVPALQAERGPHPVDHITPEKKPRVQPTWHHPDNNVGYHSEFEYLSSDSDDDSDDDAFWMDDRTVAATPKNLTLKRQKSEPTSKAAQEAELQRRQSLKQQRKQQEEGWEDLDAEDEDDPLMVSEYVVDIFEYLTSLEEEQRLPDPDYMDLQPELDWSMRSQTVDWMAALHQALQLHHESFHLAVHLLDRFLSLRVAERSRLQLYALCALLIAAKMDDALKPCLGHFLLASNDAYTKEELQRAERYMLHALQFDLAYGNPLCFLRRISKADLYDEAARTVAKYLVDVARTSPQTTSFASSKVASASMWLARRMLKRGAWDANLVHYSGYCEQELVDTVRGLYALLQDTAQFPNVCSKYDKVPIELPEDQEQSVSQFVREWMQATPSWECLVA